MEASVKEKVGVYVCHCGSNIAGVVDVEEVQRKNFLMWRLAGITSSCARAPVRNS